MKRVAVIVVALAVLIVGIVVATRDRTPPAAVSGQTTAPTSTSLTGGITPGQGASGLAPDGITPIGWTSTCDGAVAAATAAVVAFTDPVGTPGWGTPAAKRGTARTGLTETIARLTTGTHPSLVPAAANAYPQDFVGVTAHPEWGGYRVASCTAGSVAVVDVFSCATVTETPPAVTGVGSNCYPRELTMRWVGAPSDWRVAQWETTLRGAQPGFGGPTFTDPNPPTAAQRRTALAAGGPGWQEYANAPR